jgi:ArsR family transcriptional regulator
MAFSKANKYNKDEQFVNHYSRAISYPARQEILKKLYKDGPCTVNELLKDQPISKATFSQHLKNLRDSHLITYKEVFPSTYYIMDMEQFYLAKKYLTDFLDFFGNQEISPG